MEAKITHELREKRYILDPLYGPIYFPDYLWEFITVPELQRLREIRLCNINSLLLTGASNINRFEHAIGTCYLALQCIKSWPPLNPLFPEDKKILTLSALFHDVVSAPFGHSVDYIMSKSGFRHETSFLNAVNSKYDNNYDYKGSTLEPIFFGLYGEISSKLTDTELKRIDETISGKGRFGPLINSLIDLDNIDNVFRLCFHSGIIGKSEVPIKLAQSIYVEKGKLTIKKENIELIQEWQSIRKKLYKIFLLNPVEFSAKSMLSDAIEFSTYNNLYSINWHDVDFEILLKFKSVKNPSLKVIRKKIGQIELDHFDKNIIIEYLRNNYKLNYDKIEFIKLLDNYLIQIDNVFFYLEIINNYYYLYEIKDYIPEISQIVNRLMKGELYGCIGIFSTSNINMDDIFKDLDYRMILESKLGDILNKKIDLNDNLFISFHTILDINKTEREIKIMDSSGEEQIIGKMSKELLIGVFLRNPNYSFFTFESFSHEKRKKMLHHTYLYLKNLLNDIDLKVVQLYDEINEI